MASLRSSLLVSRLPMHLEFSPLCLQSFTPCPTSQYLISLVILSILILWMVDLFPTAFSVEQINNYHCDKDKHVHLMCERPDIVSKQIVSVSSLSAHIELGPYFHHFKDYMIDSGLSWGVVISPTTPISDLHCLIDSPPDRIVVMAVKPGFSGQAFLSSTLHVVLKVFSCRLLLLMVGLILLLSSFSRN